MSFMNRLSSLKRVLSFLCAAVLSLGVASNSQFNKNAGAEETYTENYSTDEVISDGQELSDVPPGDGEYDYGEPTQQEDQGEQYDSGESEEPQEEEASGFDISMYAEQLREISEKQQAINKEIDSVEDDIEAEEKKQKLLLKKINSINEEIDVLNQYMTVLELQISTNERNLERKQNEIDEAIEEFKRRLRAMYIAGSDSYTDIVLQADDFYDVLMRLELIKRVAKHDDSMIDNLVRIKEEYEKLQKELDGQKAEYDKQSDEYNQKRQVLTQLYSSSMKAQMELQAQNRELEKQNRAYDNERMSFEGTLSDVLKSSGTGGTARDNEILATMALADEALDKLHEEYRQRVSDGEDIPDSEPDYYFDWPVPSSYNITYGVGARWGSYHNGIDIGGDHGALIRASESGTVIRTNTTCTHDYGKSSSCGCGGGYGNFIILDHGNGFITLYGHLSALDVDIGDTVKAGDVIGRMGSTGFSTGDHLHFEIRYNGYVMNPVYYVDIK